MANGNNKIYDLSEFTKKYRCNPEGDCGASWLIKDVVKYRGIEPSKLKHAERRSKPVRDEYFGCDKECIMNGLLLNILVKEERMSLREVCQTQDVEVYKMLNGVKDLEEGWKRWTDPQYGREGKSLAEIFSEEYKKIRKERKHKLKEARK